MWSTHCLGVAIWRRLWLCEQLRYRVQVQRMVERAKFKPSELVGLPLSYWNNRQMEQQLRINRDHLSRLRLHSVVQARMICRRDARIDKLRKVTVALAEGKVPRLQLLARAWLARGASPQDILASLASAAAGLRKVQGFDDADMKLAQTLYTLAGEKGAQALHTALGLPSTRTLRRHRLQPTFKLSTCMAQLAPSIEHDMRP